MQKRIISIAAGIALFMAGQAISPAAENSPCSANDPVCREFHRLADAGKFDAIIAQIDAGSVYTEASRVLIGQAYLALAGQDANTPEQEEMFCRKALEYGATSAYMGLYFIYAQRDHETALGFLKQYVATRPRDSVPYVILGDAELEKKNYRAANEYLREAKNLGRGRSANLDWMLFQVSYLLGDYAYASAMLEDAVNQTSFVNELSALASDPRFSGMEKRPEFRKYEPMIKGTIAKKDQRS